MTIVFNHTIMIYCCSSIYNAMITYYSISVNNSTRHHHRSLTYFCRRRNNGRRMDSCSKLNSGIVSLQSLHYHFADLVHPNAHNHGRKPSRTMHDWTTSTLLHIRVIIHKSLNLYAIGIQDILYHFSVTTCTK